MSNEYRLEKVKLGKEWDSFVKTSENGTIFSYSDFLLALKTETAVYYCYKKQELKAGVVLVEADKGKSTCLHDCVIYSGLLFTPPIKEQNRHQVNSEKFRITTFVAEKLPGFYRDVHMVLHPTVVDIRPFLWVNYGTDLPKYLASVRYTSYVSIEDFHHAESLEDICIYNEASYSRRQEIRYGIKKNVITKEEFDCDKFVQFYFKTMKRQDIIVPQETLDEMGNLIKTLFKAKLGKMFMSYTNDDVIRSMAFFSIDNKRAYFLFGANDPKMRNKHTGTMVLWDAFKFLSQTGVKEVDLEGINSPHRGWFKLSFGGDLRPYYEMCYQG